jgi:hypothetical protein
MSVVVPDKLAKIPLARFRTGEVAKANAWGGSNTDSVVSVQNYFYSRIGARIPGIIFETPFSTDSAAYTSTNSTAGGRDLNTWTGGSRLWKVLQQQCYHQMHPCVHGYGQNITVILRAFAGDTKELIASVEVDHTGSYGNFSGSLTVPLSEAHEGDDRTEPRRQIYYTIQARSSDGTNTAYLHQFSLNEWMTPSQNLPETPWDDQPQEECDVDGSPALSNSLAQP